MTDAATRVRDADSLQQAIAQNVATIEIEGRIANLPSLKLPAGTRLRGAGPGAELHFNEGQAGVMLSADHQVSGLRLVTDETQVALGLADDANDLGAIVIADIQTVGRVHLEASQAKRAELKLSNIHAVRRFAE